MKIFILNILLLISPMFYAQVKEDNVGFTQYSSSVFDSKEKSLNVVSSMMNEKKADNNMSLNNNQNSSILIRQIGDFNKVDAALKAIEAKLSVEQKGYNNELLFDKTAKKITQNVIQQGDNNKITDFTLYTNYNIDMEMIQNGDNHNIQSIGTNSMSKNMKITQTGNGGSIILINK